MHDFPLLKNITYLDSAATTQTPVQVVQAMADYYEHYRSNTHRGLYALSERATEAYERTRTDVASLLGKHPEEIIFTQSTTYALNMLSFMLEKLLTKKDTILISEMEHHSNYLPWKRLCERTGARLEVIPLTDNGLLDQGAIEELLPSAKILALTQASNVLGTTNPGSIFEKARQQGTITVLDAAQSLPHLLTAKADFIACSAHKMLGPTGVGVLAGKKDLLETLDPPFVGGGMVANVKPEQWMELPLKFEAGTQNIAGVIGWGEAIAYLRKHRDLLERKDKEITAHFLAHKPDYLELYGPTTAKNRLPIFSFNLQGIHCHDVASMLAQNGICVRAGHHCAIPIMRRYKTQGMVRASAHLYNTTQDIDALFKSIERIRKRFA
ncbi:MAG: aminotransferase class V-fold PLP-dependent enzyme [archaeon]